MPPRIDFRSGISCFIGKMGMRRNVGKCCMAFLALAAAWLPLCATSWQTLTLTLGNGMQASFALSRRPVMTFHGEEMVVSSQGGQTAYAFSALDSFAYSDAATAVEPQEADQTVAYPNPVVDFLYLRMAAKASSVRVFDGAGRREKVAIRPMAPDLLRLDVSKLGRGMHVVHV